MFLRLNDLDKSVTSTASEDCAFFFYFFHMEECAMLSFIPRSKMWMVLSWAALETGGGNPTAASLRLNSNKDHCSPFPGVLFGRQWSQMIY